VSRQGYHKYIKNRDKPYKYAALAAEIEDIIKEDECNDKYGYPRIHDALKLRAEKKAVAGVEYIKIPSKRTIYRVMQHEGLTHELKRKPNGITKEDKEARKSDDLLKRDFSADEPNVKAVTDITEIPCKDDKKLYISGLFDCFDLMPLGLSMADNMKAKLCVETLEMAAKMHNIRGLTAHSDRGSQYTSKTLTGLLAQLGFRQSFSRVGMPGDNSWSESFFATMKKELVHWTHFGTRDEARAEVFDYIYGFYNVTRIQKGLGYMSPRMFRESLQTVELADVA